MTARRVLVRALCAALCVALAVVATELVARVALPDDHAQRPAQLGSLNQEPVYRLDDELGFCPIAPGPWYTEHGVAPNRYAFELPADRARVTFVGDSVTSRARIAKALVERLPDSRIECAAPMSTG